MKIKKFLMEDWLEKSINVKYDLSTCNCENFYLGKFLKICGTNISILNKAYLSDSNTIGSDKLRKEIAKCFKSVKLNEILVTNSSLEGIFCFLNVLLDKGDEVIIPFPSYQALYQIPISIGCKVRFLNLFDCKDWKPDLKKLDKLVTKRTKLIIINSPHNPIGWTLTKNEIKQIGLIAKKNNCYLFFDEYYRFFPLTKSTKILYSAYDICKKFYNKIYVSGGIAKTLGVVGLRVGFIIGDTKMLYQCRAYKDYITHAIPEVTDILAYLALKHKTNIIKLEKRYVLKNIQLLNNFMKRNSDFFEYKEPTGGFSCFPRIKYKVNDKKFCKDLFDKYEVSLLPGYGFETKDHFRLGFGKNTPKFKEALDRMQKYIDKLKE